MALHHCVLAGAYYPCKMAKAVGQTFGITSPHRLRVLLCHDIAPQDQSHFGAQMRWLARSWNFVSAEEFGAMISGDAPIRGRNLLLTFDDGFASNRVVAEQVLNPLGIRALFFAVSEFVALGDREEARQFIARHVYPDCRADDLPAHWRNMGWSDLEALLEQGHCVGGHTRTHARLSEISAEADLVEEIIDSANALEHHLGVPIEHFAYPFGDLRSFSESALAIAGRRFRFIYSGLRGDNVCRVSPHALWRDGFFAYDPLALVGACVEGLADFYYGRSRAHMRAWAARTRDVLG